MKTTRNLSRIEIFELAKQNGLKISADADYIYVYEFKSNDGLRANDVSIPTSYNMWSYHTSSKSVSLDDVNLDFLKSEKVLNFIKELKII